MGRFIKRKSIEDYSEADFLSRREKIKWLENFLRQPLSDTVKASDQRYAKKIYRDMMGYDYGSLWNILPAAWVLILIILASLFAVILLR